MSQLGSTEPVVRVRQCKVRVYKRDTYRYSGGKMQFKLHYTQQRCSRKAMEPSGYCRQHAKMATAGVFMSTYEDEAQP